MNTVVIITQEQYELIKDKPFSKGCYFNPVKNAYDEWTVSFEELLAIEDKQFNWLWDCPMKQYVAPYSPNDFLT
jgi:hypothetical protein